MKCFLESKRASITPMVSIIMASILVLNFVMIDVLNIKSFTNNTKRRANLASSSCMAEFDQLLLANYGLYAINEEKEEALLNCVFNGFEEGSVFYDTNLLSSEIEFNDSLSDIEVLKNEIKDLMTYKSWGNAAVTLAEKITSLLGIKGSASCISYINKASSYLDNMYDEDSVANLAINGVSDLTPDGVNGLFTTALRINIDENVEKIIDLIPDEITFHEGSDCVLLDGVNLLFSGIELYNEENEKALSSLTKIQEYKKNGLDAINNANLNLFSAEESEQESLKKKINELKNKLNSFDINLALSKISGNIERYEAAFAAYNELKMSVKDGNEVNAGEIKNLILTLADYFENYEKVIYREHTRSLYTGNSSYTSGVDDLVRGNKFLSSCVSTIDESIYKNLPSQEAFSSEALKSLLTSLIKGDSDFEKYTKIIENTAEALSSFEGILETLETDYYIDDYISTYFKNGIEVIDKNSHYLNGEIEYIIMGGKDERSNATGIYAEIFALRTLLNMIHIYTDSEKEALLTETAESISVLSEGAGVSIYKAIIAFSWASLESSVDLENLENHKKVPLVKKSSDWKTSIDGITSESTDVETSVNVTDMDYGDYLRILLCLVPMEVKLYRIEDILELNLYKETGTYVHIESYKTSITLDVKVGLKTLVYEKDNKKRFYLEVTSDESY